MQTQLHKIDPETSIEFRKAAVKTAAIELVHEAQRLGVVVTVGLRSRKPLAMRNYSAVVDARAGTVQSVIIDS